MKQDSSDLAAKTLVSITTFCAQPTILKHTLLGVGPSIIIQAYTNVHSAMNSNNAHN